MQKVIGHKIYLKDNQTRNAIITIVEKETDLKFDFSHLGDYAGIAIYRSGCGSIKFSYFSKDSHIGLENAEYVPHESIGVFILEVKQFVKDNTISTKKIQLKSGKVITQYELDGETGFKDFPETLTDKELWEILFSHTTIKTKN